MKFKLKQNKLQELLEKLQMGDIFPLSILATREGKVISIQKDEHGNARRYAKFESSYFEEIEKDNDAVQIDVAKALSLVKLVPSTESITVEKVKDRLNLTDCEGTTFIHYEEPKEVEEKLPFEIKNGIPYVSQGTLPLTTKFTADLSKFKLITDYGRTLKTEYYKFLMTPERSIKVKVGDLHSFSDGRNHLLPCEVLSGESLEVCFTYGIPQIADTFRQEKFTVQTLSNAPGFFSEGSKEQGYHLALVIPPFTEEE